MGVMGNALAGFAVFSKLRYAFNRLVYVGLIVAISFYFLKFDAKVGGFVMATKFSQKEFDLFVR